jgi:hypothetical protein
VNIAPPGAWRRTTASAQHMPLIRLPNFMVTFLIFLLGAVIGLFLALFFVKNLKLKHSNILKNVGMFGKRKIGLIEKQAKEKERNKMKIMRLFEKKDTIKNNDVERLLFVSDATATNYLDELEYEKKIKQVGKTGYAVYYEKL